MSIRIVIADDHAVVRDGLIMLLAGTEIEVVGQAATGDEAVRLASELKPSLVLLDVRMGGGDGLAALGRLKIDHPDQAVLMFSAYDNPTYVARAVALGAAGYLLKECTRDELLTAIRAVAAGDAIWTREELRRVTGALAAPRLGGDTEVPLTQREADVLRQIALGLTNREIAQTLDISYETVKEHVQNMLRKIGVSDRTQAAVWAVRKGLV
ncbi:MAG: response regulator transcription factor [Pirellulales bacterium]|nr:response regulator transcription factor [Pirellulales bacterium]